MANKKDTKKTTSRIPEPITELEVIKKIERYQAPKVKKLDPEMLDEITAENKLEVIEELEEVIAFVKETGDKDTELLLSKLLKVAKDK